MSWIARLGRCEEACEWNKVELTRGTQAEEPLVRGLMVPYGLHVKENVLLYVHAQPEVNIDETPARGRVWRRLDPDACNVQGRVADKKVGAAPKTALIS
ncbi:hypothetical protein GOC91_31490 [Sinorhizobium medicae]|uniref:Uncharacterized protein n=2 Tax=Sinorhizobium medicae TaxID=110321 RepID=A6UMB4_SINMW|nr:hypothetical protein [Sinorhizobium medicae]PND17856.1 hypothetical protein CN934_31505 [Ensifer sp. MMN_5]ABR64794.1 hypothetical protein Smed_6176 [Sinorhizobium medicae WSM419]MBO1945087.1 hypothetical protein [Sinorhizobium medicae]MBO1960377.1 hypothetical protein [Sinorhizobium medicae]MDX0409201.1 hypothetical protein [Sinorhizobium medicae]